MGCDRFILYARDLPGECVFEKIFRRASQTSTVNAQVDLKKLEKYVTVFQIRKILQDVSLIF